MFLFFICCGSQIFASHFRYGNASWRRISETTTTVTIGVTVNISWQSYPQNVDFTIENGTLSDGGTNFTIVTTNTTDPVGRWINSNGYTEITLNKSPNLITLRYMSCCKISNSVNNPNGYWNIFTTINTSTSSNAPVSAMPAVINMPVNVTNALYNISASDPDQGTILTYRFATAQEDNVSVPTGLSIDANTGQLSFDTTGKTVGQLYNVLVVVTDNDGNGILIDFLINIIAGSTAPEWDYSVTPANNTVYNIVVGEQLSFSLKSTDSDVGSTVKIGVSGLPNYIDPSIVFRPNLPAQGNLQSESVFTWIPNATASGKSFVLNFLAQDDTGMGSSTSILIKVNSEEAPVFVQPSPDQNSIRQILPGAIFSDVIKAQSTIGSMTSIVYAAYPTGVSLDKTIPTQNRNPSEVMVNWASTAANFGPNVFEFQVAISSDPSIFNSRKYTVVVNTPSFFESTALTTALLGQKYSYTVNINDVDIAFGDKIELNGVTIPSWLTLVKISEKEYLLEGTPSLVDVGLNTVSLQAEDIYHHDPSSDYVFQNFDVNVKQNQTISFDPLINKSCGDLPFNLTATASSGLQVFYNSSDPSVAKIDGTLVTILKTGVVTITATQTGKDDYVPAIQVVQNLTVEDKVAPIITADGDKNVNTDLNVCGATVVVKAAATDNCSVGLPTGVRSDDLALDALYPVGTTTIAWNVTDANNNNALAVTQTIVVTDIQKPVAITKNITVQLDADGLATITPAEIDNFSTDACGIATLGLDKTLFTCANVGANTVILIVTDSNGNVSTQTAIVTVEDKVAPVVLTKNITVQLNVAGNATLLAADVNNGSTDACGIATLGLDKTSFTCANVGVNTVTLKVTDNNGNVASLAATVTVEDKIAPVVLTKNITVQLNAAGNATIVASDINNGSTDACGIATLGLDKTSFSCENVGVNTVILTVIDNNGNFATQTAIVTVEDKVAPVVVIKNKTIQLNASGTASIIVADINNGSTDNCGISVVTLDKMAFTCANVGANTVTLKVTDNNGNVATQTAIVTVEEKIAPVVFTKNITVQLDASSNIVIAAADVNNGSTDNCGISLLELDKALFSCANVGENVVTLKVTDINGNVATKTAIITFEDKIAPAVFTKNITVPLNAAGNATLLAADVNNGSTDACGIATLGLDKTSFSCVNVGVNTVILTVTDNNGNVATQTAIVTVEDKVAPVVVTKNSTIQLNASGTASIVVADINNGSTDNCGISIVTLDKMAFTCANVGANTVTLKVTDNNGNVATQTAIVTVEDKIAPVVFIKNITVPLDASSNIVIAAADVNNGSTDNCGISLVELDKALFSCADVGENVVTLKVTDNSGNVATKTAIVTIVNSQPNLIKKHFDDVIFFDNSSKAFITFSWYKNGVLVSSQTAQYFKDSGVLNGIYYAKATKIDGTVVTTCPLTFSASKVDEYLKIAPNPVKSFASYQILTNVDSVKLQNARITVFNILGVQVNEKMVDGKTTVMSAPSTEGIYVVRMTLTNGKYFTKNLLVKN